MFAKSHCFMKKEVVVLLLLVLLTTTGMVRAEEEKELGITLDITYASKYMSKGGRFFGSKSAIYETLDFDLYQTGFGLTVHNRRANSSGYENKERNNYGIYYKNSFFDDESYKTNYKVTWEYHHYVDEPRTKSNKNEWNFDFSWPEILPAGLVPQYTTWYEYPGGSGYDNRDITGWSHRFGLNYPLAMPELTDQVFNLCAYVWYRDGVGGATKDHDWSHATFGISTQYKISENLSFVPAIYYQSSWEDTVNTRDEVYCKLSMKYKF